jgi:hypothetical protein
MQLFNKKKMNYILSYPAKNICILMNLCTPSLTFCKDVAYIIPCFFFIFTGIYEL